MVKYEEKFLTQKIFIEKIIKRVNKNLIDLNNILKGASNNGDVI